MNDAKNLKKKMKKTKFIAAPGAYDALTAKIIESQGFPAVYMTGYGTSVSGFGLPDLGFLTMTEMVRNAARMADAVEIPLIADADTGYGNPMNVVRTVREFEKAGVSAIHLEDQQWPKRCGHMDGKMVVETRDMAAKIKAAVDARRDDDFLIIARTDALAVNGLDDAAERANIYSEAGADILFVEAPRTREEMEKIPEMLPDKPLLINMAPLTPNLSIQELQDMGYSLALYPGVCLAAVIAACNQEVRRLKDTGKQKDFSEMKQSFGELNEWLKAPYYLEMEQRYKT
jgi:2,3-dimethylmalate lyase